MAKTQLTGDQVAPNSVPVGDIQASGTKDSTTFLRGDGQWATPPGGSGSSPNTTKGDIHGFSTVDARIPVGVDGQVLVADSGQALGLGYQNVSFLTRRNAQINSNPGALTLSQFGYAAAPTITANAVTTQGDDTDGSFITLNTAATAAGLVSSVATAYTQYRREWRAEIAFRIKTTAVALTSPRIWVGLFSASPAASDAPLIHIAGFRFVSAGAQGSANWRGITAAGTATQGNVDTGVPVAINTVYDLRILCTESAVLFYINNKYVGQSTTNLPTLAQLLGAGVFVTTLAAAAVSLKFGWCSSLQE